MSLPSPLEELTASWCARLEEDYPDEAIGKRDSILRWLLGINPERLNTLTPEALAIARQSIQYRYRLLKQYYLPYPPQVAYRKLLHRLSGILTLRNRIKAWIAVSRDRYQRVQEVVQEVLQGMLSEDQFLQDQVTFLAQCCPIKPLRNLLLLVSLEEYCQRRIRHQPLIVYRFVNYLQRTQREGVTQVPSQEFIRVISEELGTDGEDNTSSLLDGEAIALYQDQVQWEEQQVTRQEVQIEFEQYLREKVKPRPQVAEWFQLYMEGKSQEQIAQILDLPIKQIYRFREKVNYHAIQVFSTRLHPTLVGDWLNTSLEQNLGLRSDQWCGFLKELTTVQREIIRSSSQGISQEAIAETLQMTPKQVEIELYRIYLAAHSLRNQDLADPSCE